MPGEGTRLSSSLRLFFAFVSFRGLKFAPRGWDEINISDKLWNESLSQAPGTSGQRQSTEAFLIITPELLALPFTNLLVHKNLNNCPDE
jgi:hypothetical protein